MIGFMGPPSAVICLCSLNVNIELIELKAPNFVMHFQSTTQIILKYRPNQVRSYLLWRHTENFLESQSFFFFIWSSDTEGGFC